MHYFKETREHIADLPRRRDNQAQVECPYCGQMNFKVDLCCQFCGGRLNEKPDHVEIDRLQPEDHHPGYRLYDSLTMVSTISMDTLQFHGWAARSQKQWEERERECAAYHSAFETIDGLTEHATLYGDDHSMDALRYNTMKVDRSMEVITAQGAREFLDEWDEQTSMLLVERDEKPWWKFW